MGRPRGKSTTELERWTRRVVVVPIDCWQWTGCCYPPGYGRFFFNRKNGYAHRFAYEHFVGRIPVGLVVDHMCQNKWCVNPSHMRTVTSGRNSLASGNGATRLNSLKTECSKCGGAFEKKANGYRFCRPCANTNWRATYRRILSDPARLVRYRLKQLMSSRKRRAMAPNTGVEP